MTQGSKVVQLDSHRLGGAAVGQLKLPAPMTKLRDRCGEHIRKLMLRLFEHVDDTFFDLADQASNNAEQSQYFDAMRELRLKKNRIIALILHSLSKDFQFAGQDEKTKAKPTFDPETLALVQDEALEEQVAIDNMVNRVRSDAGTEMEQLTLRFDVLLLEREVTEENNPLGAPRLIANFAQACADLEMDIRGKLVFFKLYEKQVLPHFKAMWEAANKFLTEQGVLPEMHRVHKSRPTPSPSPASAPNAGRTIDAETGKVTEDEDLGLQGARVYDDVQLGTGEIVDPLALMANYSRAHGGHSGFTGGGNAPAGSLANLPELQLNTLLSLLSTVQLRHQQLPIKSSGLVDFGNLTNRMVMSREGQPRAKLGQLDQDVMGLVSMLFEYILEDRQLQPQIKALIARLQIPMVKVALLDRSFFNSTGHSARRLLNELANASIGWSEKAPGEPDRFLNKLEEIVLRLVNEFETDLEIFDEILQDFVKFAEAEKKRRQLVEQRTRDSEEGKAKSEKARRVVQDVLNSLLQGHQVSEKVVKLLHEGWSGHLVLLYLKHGDQHENWFEARSIAAQLIEAASMDAPGAPLDIVALDTLMAKLKEGLEQTAFKPFDLDQILSDLREHLAVIAQQRLAHEMEADDFDELHEEFSTDLADVEASLAEQAEETAEPELYAALDELDTARHKQSDIAITENDVSVEASLPTEAQATESVAEQEQHLAAEHEQPEIVVVREEVDATASKTESAEVPAESSVEPIAVVESPKIVLVDEPEVEETPAAIEKEQTPDARSLAIVDRITLGTWVEISEGEEKKYRCKLAAILPTTGKYIFVNRMGVKVSEKSKFGLAMALKTGTMTLLDDGLLFDRALESVISTLRQPEKK